MADKQQSTLLSEASTDLSPLPKAHRQGLAGVTALAGLSLVSSAVVLLYLTFKLIRWHIKNWRANRDQPHFVDLSLGLEAHHIAGQHDGNKQLPTRPKKKRYPNQFLVLIYNLLLADIHQAGAFLLNGVWVAQDGITVQTSACWIQGWLVSTGDLSSSCFIGAIAVHTYLAVVRNYTPPQWVVYTAVVGLWIFNYLMAILGVAITSNGKDAGGFYVRAAAWCWVNIHYETHRLVLHYVWIFISLALTSILYGLIFLHLRKNPSPSEGPQSPSASSYRHRAFLLYPVIYVICTAPLALGRIATMAGAHVPTAYFCTAGALITSNGWLDVLLWGVTRHTLLFNSEIDSEESGIGTFNFMRTPPERKWGNMVWVEGQQGHDQRRGSDEEAGWRAGLAEGGPGGWSNRRGDGWRRLGWGKNGKGKGAGRRGKPGSQECLRGGVDMIGSEGDAGMLGRIGVEGEGGGGGGGGGGGMMAIQMDMVTEVVVEEVGKGRRGSKGIFPMVRYPTSAGFKNIGS